MDRHGHAAVDGCVATALDLNRKTRFRHHACPQARVDDQGGGLGQFDCDHDGGGHRSCFPSLAA